MVAGLAASRLTCCYAGMACWSAPIGQDGFGVPWVESESGGPNCDFEGRNLLHRYNSTVQLVAEEESQCQSQHIDLESCCAAGGDSPSYIARPSSS